MLTSSSQKLWEIHHKIMSNVLENHCTNHVKTIGNSSQNHVKLLDFKGGGCQGIQGGVNDFKDPSSGCHHGGRFLRPSQTKGGMGGEGGGWGVMDGLQPCPPTQLLSFLLSVFRSFFQHHPRTRSILHPNQLTTHQIHITHWSKMC